MEDFFIYGDYSLKTVLHGSYSIPAVFLSYIIAAIAAYATIAILHKSYSSNSKRNSAFYASIIMGSGVWGMHFVGMLAFNINAVHSYNYYVATVSLPLAVFLSWLAIKSTICSTESSQTNSWDKKLPISRIIICSIFLGLSISGTHYFGLEALEIDASVKYIPSIFATSIFASIAISFVAIIALRRAIYVEQNQEITHISATILIATAICAMHYIGMEATIIMPNPSCKFNIEQDNNVPIMIVTAIAITIMFAVLFSFSFLNKNSKSSQHYQGMLTAAFYFIVAGCSSLVWIIYSHSVAEYNKAVENYQSDSRRMTEIAAHRIEDIFNDIYVNIRAISKLPSIRKIDKHGKNLSEDDRITIQEIYNNLFTQVNISEIYIVSAYFDPEATDEVTGKKQEPIISFDSLIAGRNIKNSTAKPESINLTSDVPEIEEHEYKLITEQIKWFKTQYPEIPANLAMDIPAISGREVITCDNSHFSSAKPNEADRSGLVYSVPFYDANGSFKGVISAIFLTAVLQDAIKSGNYAITNSDYKLNILPNPAPNHLLEKNSYISSQEPDPSLIYSETMPLKINDGYNHWRIWAGIPNSEFINKNGEDILRQRYISCSAVILFGMVAISIIYIFRRNYQLEKNDESSRLLNESEKKFRNMADSMPSLLWMCDTVGERTFFNNTWLNFTGRSIEQEAGHGWVSNIHPKDTDMCIAKYTDAINNRKKFELWYRMRRNDGEYRWMLDIGQPQFNDIGECTGFIGASTDITERKLLEEKIKEHRDNLQQMVDAQTRKLVQESDKRAMLQRISEAANFYTHPNDVIRRAIDEICAMTGWPLAHCFLLDRHTNILHSSNIWSQNALKKYPEFVKISENITFDSKTGLPEQVLASSKTIWITNLEASDNFPRKKVAKQENIFSGVASPIIVGTRTFGVLEFFSEKELLEDEEISKILKNIGMQIGRAIERKAQEEALKEAMDKTEKLAQAKTEFLSNMSHELRTPMHAILNYAGMGLRDIKKSNHERLPKYFGNIESAGQRLLSLINNLLDLSKLEAGKMDVKIEKTDLLEAIENIQYEMESLLKAKDIILTVSNKANSSMALFDKNRIIQVLVNLVSNAIKFSPESAEIKIEISDYENDAAYIKCSIADEGGGIPESELEAIFDKFIQSSKVKTGAGGTGLGLSICREIIIAHAGKIWAKNGNKGAIFSFTLKKPIAENDMENI